MLILRIIISGVLVLEILILRIKILEVFEKVLILGVFISVVLVFLTIQKCTYNLFKL